MTHFRKKLAVILFDSELNDDDLRNRALKKYEETNNDPNECVILDKLNPRKNSKHHTHHQKLSFCRNHWSFDDLSIQQTLT